MFLTPKGQPRDKTPSDGPAGKTGL